MIIPVGKINDINYCNNCHNHICSHCIILHNYKYPNHVITKIKSDLLFPNEKDLVENLLKCNGCNKDLNDSINNHCIQCKENLCNECADKHMLKYPSHKLNSEKPDNDHLSNSQLKLNNKKISQIIPNINSGKDYNQNKNVFDILIPNDKCISCYNDLNMKEDDNINHCNACLGNLCNQEL